MGDAVERFGGRRWQFLALVCASADVNWLARVDLGENALSVLAFGLIFRFTMSSIPALALASWSRLNFLWVAWPAFLALWASGRGRRFLRLCVWGGLVAFGLWLASGFSPGRYLDLPWRTPNLTVATNMILWSLAGRLVSVGAYLLDGWQRAEHWGAAVICVWGAVTLWLWRRGKARDCAALPLLLGGVIAAHSFFLRPLSYWHIGAVVPVMIFMLSLWVAQVERAALWVGRVLWGGLMVLFLSAWPSVHSSRGHEGIAVRHSPVMAELMKFCELERCAVVDTGILHAVEMQRPKRGVADLHYPALKRDGAEYLRLTEKELGSWFVFLSGSRGEGWHQAPWVLPLWQSNGFRLGEQKTLDDSFGVPVYWLVKIARASDR